MNNTIPEMMSCRASCRSFRDREIPEDVLERVLDCAVKSPSTSGFQDYSIIVVRDREKLKLLGQYSMNQKFIGKAPAAIVFCIDLEREKRTIEERPAPWKEDCNFVNLLTKTMDTAIAAQTLCLAAEGEGLRSVFIANFLNSLEEVSLLLELPDRVIPSLMVVIGYGEDSSVSAKYKKHVLIHKEQYRRMSREELAAEFDEKYRNWKVKPTEKMITEIIEAAEAYEGNEYALRCRQEMESTGTVNPYQFYYGFWYRQGQSELTQEKYAAFLESKKIFWLKGQKDLE